MPKLTATKKKVAEFLTAESTWVSGESISAALDISRAAVSKHIAALREEGYLIESAPRRGYLCRLVPDAIDVLAIKNKLQTEIVGRSEWILVSETVSTNQEAIVRAGGGLPD
jgi:BirA family biotin operon repressor/biotin-[acetyl-CoA-carboxylase] ligase